MSPTGCARCCTAWTTPLSSSTHRSRSTRHRPRRCPSGSPRAPCFPRTISALCEQVGQIEGRADASFDLGLTRLRAQLKSGEIDTIGYIDRKELYEHIENVVDKCDDVANAIQSITAKHA